MYYSEKCPICENEADVRKDYIDYTLCEELLMCPHCGYQYVFAYGQSSVYVGKKEFHFGYQDTEHNRKVQEEIVAAEKIAIRRQKVLRVLKKLLFWR